MAKEAHAIENAERELKYHEYRMKQEWRKLENRIALMDLRLERAKEVRDQYIDYLQTKYPQWRPNFKTFQRQVTFVQPTAKNFMHELATSKYHYIDEKPKLNFAEVLQTSKLAPKSPIPSSNSTLLKGDLDVIKRRLNEISNDLHSLREDRLALSRTDSSAQARDRLPPPSRDDEFLERTSPGLSESFVENRHRSASQPPPARLAQEANRTESNVFQRIIADQLDQAKISSNETPLMKKGGDDEEEPTRLIRSDRFQQELQEVKEMLSKDRPLIQSTSVDIAPAPASENMQRRARFDFSSKPSETILVAPIPEENIPDSTGNKAKEIEQVREPVVVTEKAPTVPLLQVVAPAPVAPSPSVISQPIPQSYQIKNEPPSASYQQMLGLITHTANTKDDSSETDSLEERLAIGIKKPAAKPEPIIQEPKVIPAVLENIQPRTEKKPADELLAKLFPTRKPNAATSVQTKKILFAADSSSDESVDLKGKGGAGNDSDSDFFG